MAEMGHNGGPPQAPLTPKAKIECIKLLLDRSDLSAAQKCIGIGIIAHAGKDWQSEVLTSDLQRFSTTKDRETVFRATRTLDDKRVISKLSVRGQAGRYTVLPPAVVEAIVEAFDEAKSGPVKPDHSEKKWSGETGRHKWSASPPEAVGFDPTSQQSGRVEPDGFDPTSSKNFARAQIESPTGIVINKNNNLSPQTPLASADPYSSVSITDGKLSLVNGLRQYWLQRFDGDEITLDLALLEIAGGLQVNSRQPLEAQVSSRLARMCRDKLDKDKRYDKAVKRREAPARKASDLYSAEAIERELLRIEAEDKR